MQAQGQYEGYNMSDNQTKRPVQLVQIADTHNLGASDDVWLVDAPVVKANSPEMLRELIYSPEWIERKNHLADISGSLTIANPSDQGLFLQANEQQQELRSKINKEYLDNLFLGNDLIDPQKGKLRSIEEQNHKREFQNRINAGISGADIGYNLLNNETDQAREIREQRRNGQNTKDKKFQRLLHRLRQSVEFLAFEAAFTDFKSAVDAVRAGQDKIDAYIKAIQDQDHAEMRELLENDGIDTSDLTNEEIEQKALEQLAKDIDSQAELIEVMKKKAQEAQAKWDEFAEKNPELANDPAVKERFHSQIEEQMIRLGKLVEAQNENVSFMDARKQAAKSLNCDNEILKDIDTDHKANNSEIIAIENEGVLEDDLGSDLDGISFSSNLDGQETSLDKQQNITPTFNAMVANEPTKKPELSQAPVLPANPPKLN
ncbi:MAG: hypothetical protein JJ975_06010 [Bacteroidia bacterium]|nr:hypothetical protein [Bacteroidia bacterium]